MKNGFSLNDTVESKRPDNRLENTEYSINGMDSDGLVEPDVTVVITSYNAGAYLKEAVESVIAQTYHSWKILIIDDASTDDSLEGIQPYLDDHRVEVIVNPINYGQTKCLNIALEHVTTPFMVQLDSDDWFETNALEILAHEAKQTGEDVALVCANIKIAWQDDTGKINKSEEIKGKSFVERYDFMLSNRSCWPRFYRTAALKAVGGWSLDGPHEGRYIEDLRILYRLIPQYRFRWIDTALYNHRRHKHNMTNRVQEMKETLYWLIPDTLQQWGGFYEPRYKETDGYPSLIGLVPRNALMRPRGSVLTALTTGPILNTGDGPSTVLTVMMSNDDPTIAGIVELAVFQVPLGPTETSKVGAALQRFSVTPNSVITRKFNITGFPAFEVVLQVDVPGIVMNVFASDDSGNLNVAQRVLHKDMTFLSYG